MKEIKFRAWDKKHKKMAEVYTLGLTGVEYTTICTNGQLFSGCGKDDIELMQFTGLHDKNGKEIYEGDVLKREGEVGVVRWDDSLGRFRVYMDDNNPMPRNYPLWFELIEVIGNIYENPELAGRTE